MADIFELFKKIGSSSDASGENVSYIIAGLGNPGEKYAKTRHNAGFIAIDYMCEKFGYECKRSKWNALTGEVTIGGKRVLLMKPQTYMNASGEAVGAAADFYKLTPDRIIIISDDVELEPGAMRIRSKGSAGGQRGLKSIIEHLGSNEFPRIRIGVGKKPHADYDLADWVLGSLSKADVENMLQCFDACREACELIMDGKCELAMSKFNGLKPKDKNNG